MTQRALLVVDVQNDFTEGGALAVAGGAKVAADITSRLLNGQVGYDLVIASRDWHNPAPDTNEGHFAPEGQEPNFTTTWPVHCVAGTSGADYHPDLHLPEGTVHVFKGQGRSDYSAFQGVTAQGKSLREVLEESDIAFLDVVGIATDHCVLASVKDALTIEGLTVQVIEDLTAGVDKDASFLALVDMADAGAQVGTIDQDLLSRLAQVRADRMHDDQLVAALNDLLAPTATAAILGLKDRSRIADYLAGAPLEPELAQHARSVLAVLYFLSSTEGEDLLRTALLGTSPFTGDAPLMDLRARRYEETKSGFTQIINGGY